jgi:oxygen-independent coproporphyrinogen-3 oxidase
MAADAFVAAGYRWIGGDLFVLDDDPLAAAFAGGALHCSALGYGALPVNHLLAFGAGRTSKVADTLATSEPGRAAWADALTQGRWPLAATHRRSAEQRQRCRAVRQLRCGLSLSREQLGPGLQPEFDRLAALEPLGWVACRGDVLQVTRDGRYHLDRLCTLLDDSVVPPGHLAPVRWVQ